MKGKEDVTKGNIVTNTDHLLWLDGKGGWNRFWYKNLSEWPNRRHEVVKQPLSLGNRNVNELNRPTIVVNGQL